MANGWFRKRKQRDLSQFPAGHWTQCPRCRELLFRKEWERNLKVCLKCGHHFRLTAHERIALLLDEGSFQERDTELVSINPLDFPKYSESLTRYRGSTGLGDAIVSGEGRLAGQPLTVAVTDAHFMMGSMGSLVGERLTRTVERATERGIPTLLVSGSGGGARMQEGLLSLMQMAKTSGALARHHAAGLLTLVVLTDPSMAGVLASWGSLGDFILAEPGAMIGFVGQRVSQQAQVTKVPEGFQTAEYQLARGQIDGVVARRDLRDTLVRLVAFAGAPAGMSLAAGISAQPVPA